MDNFYLKNTINNNKYSQLVREGFVNSKSQETETVISILYDIYKEEEASSYNDELDTDTYVYKYIESEDEKDVIEIKSKKKKPFNYTFIIALVVIIIAIIIYFISTRED